MLVREIMISPPITISSDTTISDARKTMIEKNISRLPILTDGKLSGIVVFNDINRSLHVPGLIPEVPVEWIMSRNPITVSADTEIADAVELMIDHKVAGLPVTNKDDVVGIITETDLLKFLVKTLKKVTPGD